MVETKQVASIPYYLLGIALNLFLSSVVLHNLFEVPTEVFYTATYLMTYGFSFVVSHLIGGLVLSACDYPVYRSVDVAVYQKKDLWIAFILGLSGVWLIIAALILAVGNYWSTIKNLD